MSLELGTSCALGQVVASDQAAVWVGVAVMLAVLVLAWRVRARSLAGAAYVQVLDEVRRLAAPSPLSPGAARGTLLVLPSNSTGAAIVRLISGDKERIWRLRLDEASKLAHEARKLGYVVRMGIGDGPSPVALSSEDSREFML
jgi:hypothetical protein